MTYLTSNLSFAGSAWLARGEGMSFVTAPPSPAKTSRMSLQETHEVYLERF